MSISFDKESKTFKLDSSGSTYIFGIYEQGYLVHYYYGDLIPDDNVRQYLYRGPFASFSPSNSEVKDVTFSPDISPMEYSCNGTGDYRISAIQIRNSDGNTSTDLRYVSHKIISGKPKLEGLPSLRGTKSDCDTLDVTTCDKVTGIYVHLIYSVFKDFPAITRHVIAENRSVNPVDIERIFSCCTEFPTNQYKLIHLYGQWSKERTTEVSDLMHGIQEIGSKRGVSSHNHNPFAAIVSRDFNEDYGEAYGFNLVYSGNFLMQTEVDSRNSVRFLAGINPDDFTWRLEPGEQFISPEVVMVYSSHGLSEMSNSFHKLYMKHLIKSKWRDVKRPILINSWEAAYFNFDDQKLVKFAKEAQKLGIDMLVMDDGWFGKRDSDDSSLGDWYVNKAKLKGGLSQLINKVNSLGMKFGIWFEPEMISPNSDLYRAHPDWCLQVPGRDKSIARNQYVLDMSRKEVRDNIFEQMSDILANNNIDYLKWDFNRNLTEVGSLAISPVRQKEVFHRFVLGTYDLMERINKAFPNLLFENCSGGGGRFDPGMLYYSPQIWCSDNTDAIERLTIEFGTSLCYPISTFGAHVSDRARTPLSTRAAVAMCGTFGYELDPEKLTDNEKEEIKREISEYNKYSSLIRTGDFYRLISPTDNHFICSWEFVSRKKDVVILTAVTMRRPESPYLIIRLKGLDPKALYREEESGEIYSGAVLMSGGVNLTPSITEYYSNACFLVNDGSSTVRHYKMVAQK
jgi:alpha-galactosidase